MRSEEEIEQLAEQALRKIEESTSLCANSSEEYIFIVGYVSGFKSQFREPSTQGGEEKIFLDSESTYSLMTSSDPEKVEKGKVLRVQELSLQLVKKNKRIQVLEEALRVVHDNDFSAMLKLVPEGIEHRADTYNSADQFEYAGSYEEDARYTSPARQKMISVFIEKALNPKD